NSKLVKPVRLPPGCARLRTRPWPTGSVTWVNTIGTTWLRGRHWRAVGQDQVGRHGQQFRRVVAQFIFSAAGPAVLDPEVASLDPSELPQAVSESGHARLCLWVGGDKTHQHADASHLLALLRPRRDRPDRRPAEQCDELAPPDHSITSSARASKFAGISM